jgi:regulatory protein YycH of two-component signal transduction system YycFG
MNLERLDLEKYEVLERERSNTFADSGFQHWVSTLKVSSSYSDREGIIRANELNAQYEYSQLAGNKSAKFFPILSLFK